MGSSKTISYYFFVAIVFLYLSMDLLAATPTLSADVPSDKHATKAKDASQPPPLERIRAQSESTSDSSTVSITATDEFGGGSSPALRQLSPTHFEMDFEDKDTRMFYFKLHGVANQTIRVDLRNVSMSRWRSLSPIFTENDASDGNLIDYTAPAATNVAEPSYNGSILPSTNDQIWHYMENVWRDHKLKTLSFVQTFKNNDVFIAMKYPYTGSMLKALIARITNNPHVRINALGQSAAGRDLNIIQIDENPDRTDSLPTIVMYAREHADENDSSWVCDGAIHFLLSDVVEAQKIRQHFRVLLIPILDPDSAQIQRHIGIINTFGTAVSCQESQLYGNFFKKWFDEGNIVSVVFDIHNVESAESPQVWAPVRDPRPEIEAFDLSLLSFIDDELTHASFSTKFKPGKDSEYLRLANWLSSTYGSVEVPIEVNSQERRRHLTINELRSIGPHLLNAVTTYLLSAAGKELTSNVQSVIDFRKHALLAHTDTQKVEKTVFDQEQAIAWKRKSLAAKEEIDRIGLDEIISQSSQQKEDNKTP